MSEPETESVAVAVAQLGGAPESPAAALALLESVVGGARAAELSVLPAWGPLKLGLLICYDLEFPELARDLVLRGADSLVVPAATITHHHPDAGIP